MYFCGKNNHMGKFEAIQRYLLIINKLKRANGYVEKDELVGYVNKEMGLRDGRNIFSFRTLQRDFQRICELFGIEIRSKPKLGYYISEEYGGAYGHYEEVLWDFDLLSAIDADNGLSKYILAEHHRPKASDSMPMLIHAVRKNIPVEFDYTYIRHNDVVNHKNVYPYFLKESNQRWYLLAMDNEQLKTFGIDRISNLCLMEGKIFERRNIDVTNMFMDCYGIWDQEDIPVEDIILSYDSLDGKFIKSLPIHHSQRVLIDTDDEFRISLRLKITNDFVMELLSRSRSLTVLQPESLKLRIRGIYERALERNT